MERNECVICESEIEKLYSIDNVPISLSVTNTDFSEDKFERQELCFCKSCGCVQLKHLIVPEVLYNTTHNLTHMLPTWDEHHREFYDFILKSIKYDSMMEIGGSSGALYNKIKDSNLKYSCIDLCEPNFDISNIKYIVGNCESYTFEDVKCVAMSHVFEHLYNPNRFIENMFVNNIQTIYISIPNMTYLLQNKSSSIIHYEHTYYIDDVFIKYLFSRKGYELVNRKTFKNHSTFYQFEKTKVQITELTFREDIKNTMLSIYLDIKNRFLQNTIPENSFIIPAGHMGQLLYNLTKPTSILGFLDNDKTKQGKRQYGTPYHIYSFDKLNEYESEVNVFIYAGVYLNELLKQLDKYKNVKVHVF
jgi:hypothetical protein